MNQPQKKAKNILIFIKSRFIIKKIFGNINTKKTLEIIKYNKSLQDKSNINFDTYKKYSQKYSSIEIELILHPFNYQFNKEDFINVNKEYVSYFHIHFNDEEKETKRFYLTNSDIEVNRITIKIDHEVKLLSDLFKYCTCIKSICFKKFSRNNITDISYMFYYCQKLEKIIFRNFNTDNVTNMCGMFYCCESLKEIDVSKFNTNNVTDMSYMFFVCSSLKKLNLSNFNTNKVKTMGYMFYQCISLEELNIDNFDTNNVKNFKGMFYECKELKELNINNLKLNNYSDMDYMFGLLPSDLQKKILEKNKNKNINEKAFAFMF